jgi:hypothetical protein
MVWGIRNGMNCWYRLRFDGVKWCSRGVGVVLSGAVFWSVLGECGNGVISFIPEPILVVYTSKVLL